ncbi:MAG: beta-1,6-N-acetylglucosaminyltransferase [Roseinatronobacter sp.]|jgi:hypothetical protein|nr:beta-1,6-N-acetylglucosaminyltransferase [Roseinatronobacter sp.]
MSGPLGIVMLCHTALHRAEQVARFWLEAGCPVVIHLDRAVSDADMRAMRAALGAHPLVRFSPRHRCAWGSWQLVAATQDAAELLLRDFPQIGHVLLISGACLPLRPAAELQAHLAAHPQTDFIESVAIEHANWITGGLSEERFTLYFPFNWHKHRWAFDSFVELQRKLGMRREIPRPLRPHMGSQWWCLTRETLSAILKDPKRKRYERYFRQNWIPDESYFQTLARLHAHQIDSRSLTLVKFDRNGRPNLFYDDHLQLLRRSDCFLARKIWPEAGRLYDFFLSDELVKQPRLPAEPSKIDRYFELAEHQRREGRAGLYMQSRFPSHDSGAAKTAGPYSVFCGFDHLFQNFEHWVGQVTGTRAHGHLFGRERVQFHGGARVWHGAISDAAAIRDYNPRMFLTNLLWATRGERQCFAYGPEDAMDHEVNWFMATDANAEIHVIRGAWMLPIWRRGEVSDAVVAEVARLHKREQDWLEVLESRWVLAKCKVWTVAEIRAAPDACLAEAVRDSATPAALAAHGLAPLQGLDGLQEFLTALRNRGLSPQFFKDFNT